MPWKPGQSGNPHGRKPRGESIAEVFRRGSDPEELRQILESIALDRNVKASDRIAAVNSIADRGWGRPQSKIDISARVEENPSDRKLRALTDADLELLARLDEEADALDVSADPPMLVAGNSRDE